MTAGDLDDVGDHGDAIGARHEALGDGSVTLGEQLFEYAGSFDEPRFFARARKCGLDGARGTDCCKQY
jgi:hypothetical protein